jgi:LacI family gluconate utilization system Gnt-I transcriptional repressor
MSDVAEAAGVALATVSRALNDPQKLAPNTLAAVRAAIDRLGYVPDLTAGSLASARSRIVGAIVPTLANSWFAETMQGLAAELAQAGYQLMLAQSSYHPQAEQGLIDTFLGRRVDALVLTGSGHDPAVASKLRKLGIPVVETWDLPARPIDMAVGFSNELAGAAAAQHLLGRGRRRLGFLGADEPRSKLRQQGFASALHKGGARLLGQELTNPPSSIDAGRQLMAELALEQPELDGIFCSNDFLAMGALMWARENGWNIPERLSVVGFSDLPMAQAASPALTTVRIETVEIGRQAGRMLLARLRGEKPACRTMDVGFKVIERMSG